ncbi:hypothetical protein Tco_0714622 [Tanacetum coccineum]
MIFNQVRRTKVMTRALEMIPLAPSSSGMHVPRAIFVDLEPTDIDEVGNRRIKILAFRMLVCGLREKAQTWLQYLPVSTSWFISPKVGILTWPTICGCVKSQEQERVERFETYVKSKDLDLWHVITEDDFLPIQYNSETKLDEVVPFEKHNDDLKKRFTKNNKAKMVIYNALTRKEYERIFMCNTAKEIWKTLLITHQGNSQVKDNKIDLLVQQYEQFIIFEDESIDSAFARFNTIITSLKALDKGYSSKNYVRKFLRALHPKWRAKVTTIEESKDLTSLSLDELIRNLKAKKESSDEESSTSESEDGEYDMAVRDFKKFFKRRRRCGDSNHLIREYPKPPREKNQKAFVGGSWSGSGKEDDEKAKDKTCLVAYASSEVYPDSSYFIDENASIDDISLDSEYNRISRSVDLQGGRCWRGFGYKEVTRRCLEALELKGGDGGACKLLGDIRVRSWRCLRCLVA